MKLVELLLALGLVIVSYVSLGAGAQLLRRWRWEFFGPTRREVSPTTRKCPRCGQALAFRVSRYDPTPCLYAECAACDQAAQVPVPPGWIEALWPFAYDKRDVVSGWVWMSRAEWRQRDQQAGLDL